LTEESEKAARYDIRQRGLALKRHLAALESKMKEYSDHWRELGTFFSNGAYNTFQIVGGKIEVVRTDPRSHQIPSALCTVASVSLSYFDKEDIARLISDLEDTKRDLEGVKKRCEAMGDPL
jgi:hypothetical protein